MSGIYCAGHCSGLHLGTLAWFFSPLTAPISPSETMKLSNYQEAFTSVPVGLLKLCQKCFASSAAESYLHRDNQGQW